MFNIVLAITFVLAFLLSPGGRILQVIIDKPLLNSLPPYQGHLLLAFANYWVLAVIIYVLMRLMRAETWLRSCRSIQIMLGLANILIIFYVAMRILASTVQGGGASFVVMSYSPIIFFPALLMIAIGLVWLLVRSTQKTGEPILTNAHGFSLKEVTVLIITLSMPIGVIVSTLFLAENSPFRLAKEAEELFFKQCNSAGEKIIETPQNVQSVYLDIDGGSYYQDIVNGVYKGYGSGTLGESLLFTSSSLKYFEKPNDRQRIDGSTEKYRKFILKDWKGEPVAEIGSEYGVFQKALVNENDTKRLGVSGTEVMVKNLKTDKVVATLIFFTSSRHWKICGQSEDGHFGVSNFIRKSLNLARTVQPT